MTIREVFRLLLLIPWVIFLIYWIIGAFKTRPTHVEESFASRYLVVFLEVVAYLLVFNDSTAIGLLRHPIYSGLVLATIGAARVIGKWRCVLGFLLALIGYCIKARKEEEMLTQQFGDAFREHQKHTGFLLPRFR